MSQPNKVRARVLSIQRHQLGVYGVTFEAPSRVNRYLPGQFLHLTLDEFDPTTGYWPESRVFSIASKPRQDHVSIVYSVKGAYTRRMEQDLAIGKEVWLKYPYGDFVIHENRLAGRPVVLLAGGTGVAPYIPYLTAEELPLEGPAVHVYYGARLPELILFRDELVRASKSHPRIALRFYYEDGSAPTETMRKGRLNVADVEHDLGKSFSQAVFFLSGPPIMIKTFKNELLARGIEPESLKIDEWE